jgi:hypothetical protein
MQVPRTFHPARDVRSQLEKRPRARGRCTAQIELEYRMLYAESLDGDRPVISVALIEVIAHDRLLRSQSGSHF